MALYSGVLSLHVCIDADRMLKLFRAFFELCSLNIITRQQWPKKEGITRHRAALSLVLSHNKYRHGCWLGVKHTVRGGVSGTPLTNDWSAVIHNRWQVSVTYVP
jgi:hypothetical protein